MIYFHFKFLCNILATFERAMGSLIRIWKTIPMPTEATIGRNGTVTWKVKGKKRTGKLSGANRVSIQSDTWTAQYTDEMGQSRRVSTKTTNRSVAEKILAKYQTEIGSCPKFVDGVAKGLQFKRCCLSHQ